MKHWRTLGIATALLLIGSGFALAQPAGGAAEKVDCNPVFKAKAAAGKTVSSEQLARDLNMPIDQVNACLLRLRSQGPRPTPHSGY